MTIKRKMKKQTANKLLCLLLAVLLLAGQVLPALALNQEGGTITIATAEDLKELAIQCTLDSWSQGKIPARAVALAVKPPFAFTLFEWFPIILR